MIITTKQFLSSVWLIVALLVATLLIAALPSTAAAQESTASVINEASASWYNLGHHGTRIASGERYDHKAMTAAHSTLSFDTIVQVQNPDTGAMVAVRINDRLGRNSQHDLLLSGAAARQLGLFETGAALVNWRVASVADLASLTIAEAPPVVENPPAPESAPIVNVGQKNTDQPSVTRIDQVDQRVYTLQIGSFASEEHARNLAAQFENTWVASVESNGEKTFRVYFSRFETEEPARTAQSELWSKGQDSFLRTVSGSAG